MKKSKRAQACDISEDVKYKVWIRDKGKCVYCGADHADPNAHIVSRAKGGLGVETNIVSLCNLFGNQCHHKYDNGTREEREKIDAKICEYMRSKYGDGWNKQDQIYKKYA